jgi:hypothetical protein
MSDKIDETDWPLRPWLLGGGLALAGLLVHFASHDHELDAGRMALTAFVFFAPLAAAFSLERARWKEVGVFALVAGLVMAGIAWRAVHAGDHYAVPEYGFAAGVIATVLALPLFQADFHRTRWATPYRDTHFFVWTDVVSAGGALAFTGLTFAMTAVLAKLFGVIKIEFLQHLLEKEWFDWMLAGAAFGAALGVLRNQLKVLGTLQMVVLLVLSLLAVPLALALVVFLGAMVVSGPKVLWEATRSATPMLLACAAGSFVLVNAVVRDDDAASSKSPVMRIAALVLALGILPLTVLAAVSLGTRVSAYGLSPERLWGLIAITVACAYGLAYLVAVALGREPAWRDKLRRANFCLAAGTCVVALILALPILDFGAVSAANQVARLHSGKVAVEDFDYDALKWDFGDAGRRALARLARSSNSEIAKLAQQAQMRTARPWHFAPEDEGREERLANLHFQFDDPALREEVTNLVRRDATVCEQPCVVIDLGPDADGKERLAAAGQNGGIDYIQRDASGVLASNYELDSLPAQANDKDSKTRTLPAPGAVPQVEIRKYEGRQIYVNGKPAGDPFQ